MHKNKFPIRSIIVILLGMLYLFSPIDLIPDIFLPVGIIDDATIIAAMVFQIKKDLAKARTYQ